MRPRSMARRLAMQYLFQMDLTRAVCETPDTFLRAQSESADVRLYAARLIGSVRDHLDEIDTRLRDMAQNYTLERIGAVERNILRLGAGELLLGETPPKVVIDELVELAKQFGGKDSGGFVNGILDRLMREHGTQA